MARKQVAKAVIRLAKKSYSKTTAGKNAAKRKSLKDRADSRAAEVKAELAERRTGTRRGPEGSQISPSKSGVRKIQEKDGTAYNAEGRFLIESRKRAENKAAKATSKSATSGTRNPLPPIGKRTGPDKFKALAEDTKKKAATRKAAAARTRSKQKKAVGTAATAGAVTAANKRRRAKKFTDPRARSRGR